MKLSEMSKKETRMMAAEKLAVACPRLLTTESTLSAKSMVNGGEGDGMKQMDELDWWCRDNRAARARRVKASKLSKKETGFLRVLDKVKAPRWVMATKRLAVARPRFLTAEDFLSAKSMVNGGEGNGTTEKGEPH